MTHAIYILCCIATSYWFTNSTHYRMPLPHTLTWYTECHCRAQFKCAQTVIGQRSAGNGPNGLSYDYYYYYIMRWPHFDVFRKIPKQDFLIKIYNKFILGGLCKNRKDTKHLNNFSRCVKSIENIIQLIICKIIYH